MIDTTELPGRFTFTLLNPDWDKFAPYYQTAIEIFPALENAPIKNFTNGPESFTLDGNPLIGPLPGFAGVFVCTGMNSHGVTLSASAGDNAADESWLRARVADAPSGYYRQANVSEEIRLTEP